jgi:hypothetical protein
MKWINVKERLPKHQQEVLLNCNGTYMLARFDAIQKQFEMRGGRIYETEKYELYWAELMSPPQ